MGTAHDLIRTIITLNGTSDRHVARFTPSLVGMFGSRRMLDLFLTELDTAIQRGTFDEPLKTRVRNLLTTFIPQIADLNGVKGEQPEVTAERLAAISAETVQKRLEGVRLLIAAFLQILSEADAAAQKA